MFLKPLQSLTASDIEQVCKDAVQESDVVEFKEALSAKGGVDGWHNGANHIGDRARDEIIREIVAFANAHGGTLILGIEETDDHPKRAKAVKPIPACADLASRIAMFCRDVVDPPLSPHPTIAPVAIEGAAGVVVISVARSRNAPHRRNTDREAFARRADRADKMTMREIQDLTLQVDRGLAAIERRFTDRQLRHQLPSTSLAIRATAIALSPIVVPVPGSSIPTVSSKTYFGTASGREYRFPIPHSFGLLRPMLRGIRSTSRSDRGSTTLEIKEDGLIELTLLVSHEIQAIYASWFIAVACNTLDLLDWSRTQAGAPGSEYGLELEIHTKLPMHVAYYGNTSFAEYGPLPPGNTIFPRYLVQERGMFSELVKHIERDFWHAAGEIPADPVLVQF